MIELHKMIIGTPESKKVEAGQLLKQHLDVEFENSDEWALDPPANQRSTFISLLGQIKEKSIIIADDSVLADKELVGFLKIFCQLIYLDEEPATSQSQPPEGNTADDAMTANIYPERHASIRKTASRLADLVIEISQGDTPEAIVEKIKQRISS